jgi:hypothetical protein
MTLDNSKSITPDHNIVRDMFDLVVVNLFLPNKYI